MFGKKAKKPPSRREVVANRRVLEDNQPSNHQAFRRSRTIGSRRPDAGQSERQAAWELRIKRRKVLSGLFVSLGSIAGIVLLLGQLTASVQVVAPDQNSLSDEASDRYQEVLDGYLASRPLERLRFLMDKNSLQTYLLEQAPEIQSAEVVYGGALVTSDLRLSFRQPVLRWASAGKNYYVDGQGVTFERNYFEEPPIGVEDQSGVEPEVGQAVVNHRFLSFLGQVSAEFDSSELRVNRIVLPEGTVRQVDFGIEGRSYVVRMTVDRGVAEQTSRAIKTMDYLASRGVSPTYIDARVDQRVFYK